MNDLLKTISISEPINENPYAEDFLNSIGITSYNNDYSVKQIIDSLTSEALEDLGISKEKIIDNFISFMNNIELLQVSNNENISTLTIIGGHNKLGEKENIQLTIKPGEIISIVGPTGSGKSRLLGDIECLAQKDTPTGRQILLDGEFPDEDERFSIENKLIAQLSQNMNFIMDVTVSEFISMHAESRLIEDIPSTVLSIIECANELAGEQFSSNTPVTQLSGGQSRALMIADTALLSRSPIVLIDEIENAGVDRRKALELLVRKEKIVLMSTHDPILALIGNKRIVIKNGGIDKILTTSSCEKSNLEALSKIDSRMLELRNMIRSGKQIDFDVEHYLSKK